MRLKNSVELQPEVASEKGAFFLNKGLKIDTILQYYYLFFLQ